MTTVKISTAAKNIPFKYLTPGATGVWGDFQFFVNEPTAKADWWVVMENLSDIEETVCPKENTIFVAMENFNMKKYEKAFVNQFNWVVTCPDTLTHPRQIHTQQMHFSHLFWSRRPEGQSLEDFHKQFKTYDELKAMKPSDIKKTKLLSVVASSKTKTPGQKLRNEFITALKKHFGDAMDAFAEKPDVFGPDTKVEKLKWNSIAPYKYYLALENSLVPHYFTSNMPDAHLAGAFPFYHGHESILDYYPKDSFIPIDMRDVEGSIKIIEQAIANNTYEQHLDAVWKARDLWLNSYSMFPMLASIISSLPRANQPTRVSLRPEEKRRFKEKTADFLKKSPIIYKTVKMLTSIIKKPHGTQR